jgi:alanine racemase
VHIDTAALLHNLKVITRCAPRSKVIAMVKANAYGCGISSVIPTLDEQVYAFGVACLEEAMAIRALGSRTDCVLFQGVFSPDELQTAATNNCQIVIHQAEQLHWLLTTPLSNPIKVWVKVNTGMHRLGFPPEDVFAILTALSKCPSVHPLIGLMTHLGCADSPDAPVNAAQLAVFNGLNLPSMPLIKSISNSAAIFALPNTHADVVRPGIMLYGVSPFPDQTSQELGLVPVMRFMSAITAIHHYPAGAAIGYGGSWQTQKPSIIGVIAVGYGDGYPRLIAENTPVWVNGQIAPIVGRISMDMLTVDLTAIPSVQIGAPVELWGQHIPIERIAQSAGTIPYELLCKRALRVWQD